MAQKDVGIETCLLELLRSWLWCFCEMLSTADLYLL
jgi:hypothetical protein